MSSEVSSLIKKYYVYECYVDGILRYVGMGKGNRLYHCTSGKSSCSPLNKDFHEGKNIEAIKVAEKLFKADAQQLEWELINSKEGLYNIKKDISYATIPDFQRSTKYKILAEMNSIKNKPKLLKVLSDKAESMDDETYKIFRNALSNIGMSMYLVQYEGASPILIIDRTRVTEYEICHAGCLNYPNCYIDGCGG